MRMMHLQTLIDHVNHYFKLLKQLSILPPIVNCTNPFHVFNENNIFGIKNQTYRLNKILLLLDIISATKTYIIICKQIIFFR